jgi:uncharacterized glyoxalase superfamily protein PhnB
MKDIGGFRPVAINVGVKNIEEATEFYESMFGTNEAEGRPVHARLRFGDDDSLAVRDPTYERGTDDRDGRAAQASH